jgi:hypothetical protein
MKLALTIITILAIVRATAYNPTAPSAPFCGVSTARNTDVLVLDCGVSTIVSLDFVSYGTPNGNCDSGFSHNTTCDASGAASWAASTCIGTTSCVLDTSVSGMPDPCAGVIKTLAIVARCAAPPSGTARPLVPPCSMTQGTPPCLLPAWEPIWSLAKSTICQPGGYAGDSWLNSTEAARWGLISLDWSVANAEWTRNGTLAPQNMTGAATLVEQCRRIKAVDPSTLCFVYRNTELALQWMEPQRDVMADPAFKDFFLQYQVGNPKNVTPGTIYNEVAGSPATGCNQYFWNFSNQDAVEYVIGVSEQGSLGTGSPFVDGTFLDDSQALPQEHANAPTNMGLSAAQLLTVQNSSWAFFNVAVATLAAAEPSKFIWQGFNGMQESDPDGVGVTPDQGTCLTYMATVCDASWQRVPYTVGWPSAQNDKLPVLAAFLIGRGPYAFIGYGWTGGGGLHVPPFDPLWDLYDNVGQPESLCEETSSGVFSRNWTRGVATLDCNTWVGTLAFS